MNKYERFMNVLRSKPMGYVPIILFNHFCDREDRDQNPSNSTALENIIWYKRAKKFWTHL